MAKKMTTAEMTTNSTARNLVAQARTQASHIGESILVRAIDGIISLDRIRAENIQPVLGIVDGFTELTRQLGKHTEEQRKAYIEKTSDDDDLADECGDCENSTVSAPANKVSSFNHKAYTCSLDQLRAFLANAFVLLSNPSYPVSPTTPVPSVEGALGRDKGTATRH